MQRKIIKAFLGSLIVIFFRAKKYNEKNVPMDGAIILCPNHVHFFDPAAMVLRLKRKISPLAKEELLKNPIIRYLAKVFDGHPVKRDGAGIGAIKASLAILKKRRGNTNISRRNKKRLSQGQKTKRRSYYTSPKNRSPNSTSRNTRKLQILQKSKNKHRRADLLYRGIRSRKNGARIDCGADEGNRKA